MKPKFNLKLLCTLLTIMLLSGFVMAQRTVTGVVTDAENKEPLVGASVLVTGTSKGTVSDVDGKFSVEVPAGATSLTVSFAGYTQSIIALSASNVLNVQLKSGAALQELVVVGYGTQKRSDLTGSITSVTSENFAKGPITSPEQLVAGKIAGVQVTAASGAPGSGGRILIRGGTSLTASNDPLIVVDDVPLDNTGIAGSANALNLINPNDIESITVLKDASATAIYGNRGANGVILVVTKKGKKGDRLQFNFSTLVSSATNPKNLDVLTGDQFRKLVSDSTQYLRVADANRKLLGKENTNWQDAIYRTALSHDNNLSVGGSIGGVPVRASVGYSSQAGVLKQSDLSRTTLSVNASPRFLDDHLRLDFNLKGSLSNNNFADQGAIGSSVVFDPTQPIYSGNDKYGGYYEWLDPATNLPNTLAPKNPLSRLMLRTDKSDVKRSIGNVQVDYKVHNVKGLRANMNIGYDISSSSGAKYLPNTAGSAPKVGSIGEDGTYTQDKTNKSFQFLLNYVTDLKNINSRVDIMGGYEYQDFLREGKDIDKLDSLKNTNYKQQNTLVSFFSRLVYTFSERYVLTLTARQDGSSKFGPNNRWGFFPSGAFAWRLSEEPFMKNNRVFSDLKIRVGYGRTGQQEIGSNYGYLARYTPSDPTAQYPLGNVNYTTLRPEGYDANLTWETTESTNAAIDFGFKGSRVSGSIDFYNKKTTNLLLFTSVPAGSNLTNQITTNVGSLENKGVELSLNTIPVRTKDFEWGLNFNVTYNQNNITKLTLSDDPKYVGLETGGIAGGVGNNIQIQSVGYARNSFYAYKQVYDAAGKPIEGLYADLNGDGKITGEDRYRYKSADAPIFAGLTSNFTYKDFTLSFGLRSNLGNYMYNNVNSSLGSYGNVTNPNNYLSNVVPDALYTNFVNKDNYRSDYYIGNASFLRMDNLTFGYFVRSLAAQKINLHVSASVQNVFVLTKYNGLDPEIAGGIDNNFYPRPRVISIGANISF